MKKTLLTLIFCITYVSSAICQEFDNLVILSRNLFTQNQIEQFEQTYPKLYNEYLKSNLPEYRQAMEATQDGNADLALNYIKELIEDDLFLDEIQKDINFTSLHTQPQWLDLLQTIHSITSNYNNKVRITLKEIQNRDQGIRLLYLHVTENDPLKQAIHQYMKTVDTESANEVCSILNTYGWLGEDEIGSEANETLFLAIQHVDDTSVQQKYLPMLQKAVEEGNAQGWHLAFLTDRILMNQGKKQIYGTQKILSSDPEKCYIIPLEYPDEVDQLREHIGLSPLADELEEDGMTWDLDEYKQRLPVIEKMYHERQVSKQE